MPNTLNATTTTPVDFRRLWGGKRTGYVIAGHVEPGFEPVADVFEDGFRLGLETNAQLCVIHK